MPQSNRAVSVVIADGHNISGWFVCVYIWINIITLSLPWASVKERWIAVMSQISHNFTFTCWRFLHAPVTINQTFNRPVRGSTHEETVTDVTPVCYNGAEVTIVTVTGSSRR